MIKLEVRLNGKKIKPENLKNEIEKDLLRTMIDSIRKPIKGMRCKIHGEAPKVTVSGKSLKNLSVQVGGCCQEFIDEVTKKIEKG